MLEVTDKMLEVLNVEIMDSATYTKDEIKVFDSYVDLAQHIFEDDFKGFLKELEVSEVYDEERSLLENYFYEYHGVIEDESYGWIYYLL